MALSEKSSQLLTNHTNNLAALNQLYADVVSTNTDINTVENKLQQTKNILHSNEFQNLPQEAEALSTDASAVVANLLAEFSATPSVDEEFLSLVESLVLMAEKEINSTDISALYNSLLALYNQQSAELSSLNVTIEDIEQRVSRLKQIMASLPVVDCDV